MRRHRITELLIFIVGAELVGAVSALAAGDFKEYYLSLAKPPLAPPPGVFPWVWGILFALMGISAWLITDSGHRDLVGAMRLYYVQLVVNGIWAPVFFRLRSFPGAAFTAVLLAVLVVLMVLRFRRIRKWAAILNLPYAAWAMFGAYLSIGLWVLNARG